MSAGLWRNEYGLIKIMASYPHVLEEAGTSYSPAQGKANFLLRTLAKEFNKYYHEVTVLHEEDTVLRDQRLALAQTQWAGLLKRLMDILGIVLPEKNCNLHFKNMLYYLHQKSFFSCFSYEKDAGEKTSGR